MKQKQEKEAKREEMLKKRKAGIKALRAWADLARKKEEWRREDELEAGRALQAPSPQEQEVSEKQGEPAGLLDTYRELVITKAMLEYTRKVRQTQQALDGAVEAVKKLLP